MCLWFWGQIWLTEAQWRVSCPGALWLSCPFWCRAAGALGGEAEERALHERERPAPERAAGPQRLHVSAAPCRPLLQLRDTSSAPHLLPVCFSQLMFCMLWREHHLNCYKASLFLPSYGFCLGRWLLAVDGWKCLWAHSLWAPVTMNCCFGRFFSFWVCIIFSPPEFSGNGVLCASECSQFSHCWYDNGFHS